jgi:hypothetical protein
MSCPFCQKGEPVRIEMKSLDLRICPNCKASFLLAEHVPQIRRVLEHATKVHWARVLSACKGAFEQKESVLCLEHGKPAKKGEVPGFSFECFVPECCGLLHLSPGAMESILGPLQGNSSKKSSKGNGFAKFLGSFLFFILEKKHPEEDGIDLLQYDTKFRPVLEP